MLVSLLFLSFIFHEHAFAATLPAHGAITHGSASTPNATVGAGSIRYPPDGQPFYPSAPNPLLLSYRDRLYPPTRYNIPVPLIGSCVDEGVQKLEVLIAAFGEDSQIRPEERDGDFECEVVQEGPMLNIRFFPGVAEPTYEDVEWGLLAIQEASLDEDVNYHEEATILASDLHGPVSRIEMFLSEVQTEPVALTK